MEPVVPPCQQDENRDMKRELDGQLVRWKREHAEEQTSHSIST